MRIERPLRLILAVYAVLGMIYAWATPIFEASDEVWHFGMVEILRESWVLPVQDPDNRETIYRQEGSQPPLYYALGAILTAGIDISDAAQWREYNPHARVGVPNALDNKNIVLRDAPHAPLTGTPLAVMVLRGFSLLLGAVTISAVYAIGRSLVPDAPMVAVGAAGITAFNPMFLFIAGSVNNDNLVTALNSVVLLLFVRTLLHGFETRHSILLAVLLAFATLSKLSGLVLVPVIVVGAFWRLFYGRDWRGFFILGVAMATLWATLAGWWYVRNILLYGELFGTAMMVQIAGARPDVATLATLINEFEGFRIAYWGLFGTVNVLTYGFFYGLMDVLTFLGVVGIVLCLRGAWRDARARLFVPMALLLSVLLLGFVSVSSWTLQTYASQGRLLFPFVGATSVLLAWGWHRLMTGAGLRLGVILLAGFAFIVPIGSILPAYAVAPALAGVPEGMQGIDARYGDFVELVGYETPLRRYAPDEGLEITLYWRVLRQTEDDYSLFLHALDDEGQVIGRVDSYPLGGRMRTSRWQEGAIYADRYRIPFDELPEAGEQRYGLRVLVGWWNIDTQRRFGITDGGGAGIANVVLGAGGLVVPNTQPDYSAIPRLASGADFGGVIRLIGAERVGDTVTLLWEATGTPDDDFTVFAQVLNDAGELIAQGDAPPALPTRYWRSGEQYVTQHTLVYGDADDGDAGRLIVGWYHPTTFERLPTSAPDNAYGVMDWAR